MSYFLCNAAALQASLTKSTFTVYQYLAKSADNKDGAIFTMLNPPDKLVWVAQVIYVLSSIIIQHPYSFYCEFLLSGFYGWESVGIRESWSFLPQLMYIVIAPGNDFLIRKSRTGFPGACFPYQ